MPLAYLYLANDSPTASVSPVNTGSPAPQLLTSDSKRDGKLITNT